MVWCDPLQSVWVLAPAGPQPLQYGINETGLVFAAGDVIQPTPLLLGTYFRNNTAALEQHGGSRCVMRASHSPGWPQVTSSKQAVGTLLLTPVSDHPVSCPSGWVWLASALHACDGFWRGMCGMHGIRGIRMQ